jgi:hypothetical protein
MCFGILNRSYQIADCGPATKSTLEPASCVERQEGCVCVSVVLDAVRRVW